MAKCPICGGTGDTMNNIPPTNEQWFCSLPTKEKARFLVSNKLFFRMLDCDGFVEWLKEKHNG